MYREMHLFTYCFASFEEIKVLCLRIIVMINIVMLCVLLDFSLLGKMLFSFLVIFLFATDMHVGMFARMFSLGTDHAGGGLGLFVQVALIFVRIYPFNFDSVVVRSVVFLVYHFQCARQVFGVTVNIPVLFILIIVHGFIFWLVTGSDFIPEFGMVLSFPFRLLMVLRFMFRCIMLRLRVVKMNRIILSIKCCMFRFLMLLFFMSMCIMDGLRVVKMHRVFLIIN